jgi:hypothetical protein
MLAPIAVQQQARQRPPRSALAMCTTLSLARHQPGPLPGRLYPGVTEIQPMLLP